jgi:hypothetical protein
MILDSTNSIESQVEIMFKVSLLVTVLFAIATVISVITTHSLGFYALAAGMWLIVTVLAYLDDNGLPWRHRKTV